MLIFTRRRDSWGRRDHSRKRTKGIQKKQEIRAGCDLKICTFWEISGDTGRTMDFQQHMGLTFEQWY